MPRPIKKRVEKKKGIKEEEVRGRVRETLELLKSRQNTLMYSLAVLVVVVILWSVFMMYSVSMKKKALSLENQALSFYYQSVQGTGDSGSQKWETALEFFIKSNDVKSTPSALFYIGNCYFNLGDYTNAIQTYTRFTELFGDDATILPLVYQKLASVYLKEGKPGEAMKTLDLLAGYKNGVFKDTSLILRARHNEKSGNLEAAMLQYEELANNFPASPWNTEAWSKIQAREQADEGAQEPAVPEQSIAKEPPSEDIKE